MSQRISLALLVTFSPHPVAPPRTIQTLFLISTDRNSFPTKQKQLHFPHIFNFSLEYILLT